MKNLNISSPRSTRIGKLMTCSVPSFCWRQQVRGATTDAKEMAIMNEGGTQCQPPRIHLTTIPPAFAGRVHATYYCNNILTSSVGWWPCQFHILCRENQGKDCRDTSRMWFLLASVVPARIAAVDKSVGSQDRRAREIAGLCPVLASVVKGRFCCQCYSNVFVTPGIDTDWHQLVTAIRCFVETCLWILKWMVYNEVFAMEGS